MAASAASSSDGSDERFPNLRFDTANGLADLAAFLRDDKPRSVELHHFIGHDPALLALAGCAGRAVRRCGARLRLDLPSHHPDRSR